MHSQYDTISIQISIRICLVFKYFVSVSAKSDISYPSRNYDLDAVMKAIYKSETHNHDNSD